MSDDGEMPIRQHGKTFRTAAEQQIDPARYRQAPQPAPRSWSQAFQLEKTRQADRLLVQLGQTTAITLRAVLMKRSANKLLGLGLSFYETGHNYMGRIGDKAYFWKADHKRRDCE
jgi:hypothetical protein